MKKLIIFLVLALCVVIYAETAVYQSGTSAPAGGNSDVMYVYVYEDDNDVNDFSTSFNIGNAILERIVIDANGTDESFKLYLYDTTTTYGDVTLWSKTDLSTASDPNSYALTIANTAGTHYYGIPVTGNLKLTLADGDDATLGQLEIYIYYRRR